MQWLPWLQYLDGDWTGGIVIRCYIRQVGLTSWCHPLPLSVYIWEVVIFPGHNPVFHTHSSDIKYLLYPVCTFDCMLWESWGDMVAIGGQLGGFIGAIEVCDLGQSGRNLGIHFWTINTRLCNN